MSAQRIRRAERLAALDGLREERLRQSLAKARVEADRAENARLNAVARDVTAAALLQKEVGSASFMPGHYALYADLYEASGRKVESTAEEKLQSDEMASKAAALWAEGKARHDRSEERTCHLLNAWRVESERKQEMEALETWLVFSGAAK